MWEEGGYFAPETHPNFSTATHKDTFSIILPPPNANGALHFGHAMFTVEDILIRYHRMKGDVTLWLPGTDHAGIETQFVYEKKLQQEGKSRFDFSRNELYEHIRVFVEESRGNIQSQLKRLGFSLDWTREKYTLDPNIVEEVKQTFRRMWESGMVYREYRLVNYCTKDGTSFSELEVEHVEKQNPLYYIAYGPLVLATTRPETKFGDTALAVHPDDDRYREYIGKTIEIEDVLGMSQITVVADTMVDPAFGTGVVKITPAHDFADFETGKRHHLPLRQVIGYDGKMTEAAGTFAGMYVKQARLAVVEALKEKGLLVKVDESYVSRVGVCYKCKTVLEPLPREQWYIKVDALKKRAMDVVQKGEVSIIPANFASQYLQWLDGLKDWNISRQNVWGIQIPVWYSVDGHEDVFRVSFVDKSGSSHQGVLSDLLTTYSFEEIMEGLQEVQASMEAEAVLVRQEGKRYLPETDTFDTWFSSGQWPYVTLKTAKAGDLNKFYPTSVMETAYDILRAWVSRMVMLGEYVAGDVPFRTVLFHGIVTDPYGKKMSKSKGNVVNPLEVADEYGADAVRFALIFGNATGADQSLSYTKLDAAKKFSNKLWNMARFLEFQMQQNGYVHQAKSLAELAQQDDLPDVDREWTRKTAEVVAQVGEHIEKYQFNLASERLYQYIWHEIADVYIEDVKKNPSQGRFSVLSSLFRVCLHLLHPFMPFITEEIYQRLYADEAKKTPLVLSAWPK
jgi:valyl-tRNA synthetase